MDGASGATISSSVAVIGGNSVLAALDGLTLVRTRGHLLLQLLTAVSAADGFVGAFGMAKASSAAILAGVASVPTPLTEESWDGWFFHQYFSLISSCPIAVATAAQEALQNNNVAAAVRFEIDSKAMRKIDIDEGFYMAIEVVEIGAASMLWTSDTRILSKLA